MFMQMEKLWQRFGILKRRSTTKPGNRTRNGDKRK